MKIKLSELRQLIREQIKLISAAKKFNDFAEFIIFLKKKYKVDLLNRNYNGYKVIYDNWEETPMIKGGPGSVVIKNNEGKEIGEFNLRKPGEGTIKI